MNALQDTTEKPGLTRTVSRSTMVVQEAAPMVCAPEMATKSFTEKPTCQQVSIASVLITVLMTDPDCVCCATTEASRARTNRW